MIDRKLQNNFVPYQIYALQCVCSRILTRETDRTDKASLHERVVTETSGSIVDLHQGGCGQMIPRGLIGEKYPLESERERERERSMCTY